METRRDFLKKAAYLSGAAAVWTVLPDSIQRALAIEPEAGSTFLDAEHIVILMQENRSFDHSYGTLQGVRGYSDPRAHVLAGSEPVWLQRNRDGQFFVPFRLDIKKTNATWMGCLPHNWANQVDARNDGRYDQWLNVKASVYAGYEKKPLTLGHYTREDIPFYYAFADAFTICDQHFCSSLTGTHPNRSYLWSGNIRAELSPDSKAYVYNEEADHENGVSWTAFPERLEDAGISWKIYQNELGLPTGLEGEESSWLSNFGCNQLEYFTQYNVRFAPRHRAVLEQRAKSLPNEIDRLENKIRIENALNDAEQTKKLESLRGELSRVQESLNRWSRENWERLSQREKNLHNKAFCVNENDPHFRELDTLSYHDGEAERKVKVPKGDVFHQFRQDVQSGNLPTVSWLVGPEHFSDHPTSAWYGAWYVSEALDILTQNPEVWKKTIFILTYDENDGYFDHVPPFVAPNPYKEDSGLVSEGVDAKSEFITKEQDLMFRPNYEPRESSIGLGFRVPLVVASPWSRGGCVCSQVFDHTSVLQFLETFLSHKAGKKIEEPNISSWRRTVCGDLTSIFRPYRGEKISNPPFLQRNEFVEEIHRAQFRNPPADIKALTPKEIEEITKSPANSPHLPKQEKGTRRSCPLPYELYVDGGLSADRSKLEIRFKAGKDVFGNGSSGSPFNVYAYLAPDLLRARAYAVSAGKELSDKWLLADFQWETYQLRVDGPNGFMREFKGIPSEPLIEVQVAYPQSLNGSLSGNVQIRITNRDPKAQSVVVRDRSYGSPEQKRTVPGGKTATVSVDTTGSHGWYDLSVHLSGTEEFERRCAGRVETGKWSYSDPAIGRA